MMSGFRFRRGEVLCVVVAALAFAGGVTGRSVSGKKVPFCRLFYFYDDVTHQCEHCRDLCDHAEVWRTERQCQRDCSDYWRSLQCTQGEYYDEQTGTCSPCWDLCEHHDIRGTTQQCRTLCPDYRPPKQDADKAIAMPHTGTTTPLSPPEEDPKIHNKSGSESHHLIWIIPSAVVLVIAVPAALGVAFHLLRRTQSRVPAVKYHPTNVTDTESGIGIGPGTEENAPLPYPEAETQPGINSELVATGT